MATMYRCGRTLVALACAAAPLSATACSLVFGAADDGVPWYGEEWQRRRRIEIRSQVIRGSHEHFPWYVEIPGSEIAEEAQPDGRDLLFVDASGEPLAFEIESLDKEGLRAWVLLDVDDEGDDDVIFVYYDSSVAPPINTSTQVWVDYAAVYHMNSEDQAGALDDSTGNGHFAVLSQPAQTERGPLGPALDLGPGQLAAAGSSSFLEVDTSVQVSAWANARTWPNNEGTIIAKASGPGSTAFDYLLRASDSWATIGIFDGVSSGGSYANSIAWGQPDTWRHLVGRYDGDEVTLFLDAQPNDRTPVSMPIRGSDRPLVIGDFGPSQPDETRRWDGLLDEVRISNVARSDDWILTEFANQSLGPDAIRVGEVERVP